MIKVVRAYVSLKTCNVHVCPNYESIVAGRENFYHNGFKRLTQLTYTRSGHFAQRGDAQMRGCVSFRTNRIRQGIAITREPFRFFLYLFYTYRILREKFLSVVEITISANTRNENFFSLFFFVPFHCRRKVREIKHESRIIHTQDVLLSLHYDLITRVRSIFLLILKKKTF